MGGLWQINGDGRGTASACRLTAHRWNQRIAVFLLLALIAGRTVTSPRPTKADDVA